MPPEFNSVYTEKGRVFGMEPRPEVVAAAKHIIRGSDVLDLAGGYGQNACYLANTCGCDVTVVEESDVALRMLCDMVTVEGSVSGVSGDIRTFPFATHGNIIATYALQFLDRCDVDIVVRLMREHTASGGLNVVSNFSHPVVVSAKSGLCYTTTEELSAYYEDWEVLALEKCEVETRRVGDNGGRVSNPAAYIVARKPH